MAMVRHVTKLSLLLLVLSTVGCDHATKHAAKVSLSTGGPLELLPGVLNLRYTENHDVAFSLLGKIGLSQTPGTLAAMAIVVLAALGAVWWSRRQVATRLEHTGYALAVAGAIGNVTDRIFRGYVVDFIHVTNWPIFNVADIAVAVGMGLVLLASFRSPPLRVEEGRITEGASG